jgi:hypothetical protein
MRWTFGKKKPLLELNRPEHATQMKHRSIPSLRLFCRPFYLHTPTNAD